MRNLMQENGGSGGDTQLVAGQEGCPDSEAVEEVVGAVCQKVQVTNYFLVRGLS